MPNSYILLDFVDLEIDLEETTTVLLLACLVPDRVKIRQHPLVASAKMVLACDTLYY